MIKSLTLLILEFLFIQSGITQVTWLHSESSAKLEIGDVVISYDNEYFISLKNNHHIFHSKDSGTSWQQIFLDNEKNKLTLTIDKPYLKIIGNKVYCVSCAGTVKRYFFNGNIFVLLPNNTTTPSENLIINQDGQVFYKDELFINRTDSSWNRIIDKFIFKCENNYGIHSTNFYTESNNFINTSNFGIDSCAIYKVSTDISTNISIYSKFKFSGSLSQIFVSKYGTIYFTNINNNLNVFNYISNSDLNSIKKSNFYSINKVKAIYYYFINPKAEIFLVTDKGIFMNNGIDEDVWIKCYQLSVQLPSIPTTLLTKTLKFDAKYFFNDSLSALISYGDNCGQSEYYCFTPKFRKWKNIQLNLHIDNLLNLVKDKSNRMYAYRPCENFFGRNYLQSKNQGKDWEYVSINGEYATSVGINKFGEAIAIASNNRLYKNNSASEDWEEILSPVDPASNIKLFHLYTGQDELLLSGNSNKGYANETNYLYHSNDGGENWVEIKSFVQASAHPSNDFKFLIDNNNNWIVYHDQGMWTPYDVLISKDKGKNWIPDSRFKNFFYPVSITQLPDKNFLLSGSWMWSKIGTFLIDSLGNFNVYTPYYDKNPANFFIVDSNNLFGYTTYTYNDRPFYSSDLGMNVVEDESGLNPTDKETRLIRSAIYESRDKITLNLAYDGIYTSTHDIFSNISDDSNRDESYSVYQSKDCLRIEKKNYIDWNGREKFQVHNLFGQILLNRDILSMNGMIDTRQLPQGIYLLQINDGEHHAQVLKFLVR